MDAVSATLLARGLAAGHVARLLFSDLDLVVSGTRDAITMIEGFARELSEEAMLQAIMHAHHHVVRIIYAVEELRQKAGLEPKSPPAPAPVTPAPVPAPAREPLSFRASPG